MKAKTIPGHFDGEKICLDEPYNLEPDAKLIVVILPKDETDTEQDIWSLLAKNQLAMAYSDDEPEYSLDLIKEEESDYEEG
ncbi:hypothetical protein JXI42_09515 [bacterium]|nr:hypothetical protein [bacterium]